jgi:actin-related protein
MNLKSEQLNSNYDLVLDTDQPLLKKEIKRIIEINLGQSLYNETIERKEYLVYRNTQNKRIVLLVNNITFLGGNGQHPTFKKRIQ